MSMNVKGKKISVLGMARSGVAAANLLARRGAKVTVFDARTEDQLAEHKARLMPGIETRFGSIRPDADSDLIVLSPGIDIDSPDLDEAKDAGIEITGELELAFRFFKTPVIAITGTNGKSTTTQLVGDLLREAGKDVAVGGNIGTPFCDLVENPPKDYAVIEVSSFQMETARDFHPKIAAILNLTPDHLNRHKTLQHYAALKERMTANQQTGDVLVLNADDPVVAAMGAHSPAKKVFFSLSGETGDGASIDAGMIELFNVHTGREVMPVSELPQPALCQLENILAALAIADRAGVPTSAMRKTLSRFKGLEHRLEFVRTHHGIDFINDSKGTNTGALEKSLKGFDRPVVLIIGGQDKGGDFQALKTLFKQKVRHMILIGEAKQKIRHVLNGSFTYEDAGSMQEAVSLASARANEGDVVLLSPGCASFDMFRDYEDRGRQFKEIVNQLK